MQGLPFGNAQVCPVCRRRPEWSMGPQPRVPNLFGVRVLSAARSTYALVRIYSSPPLISVVRSRTQEYGTERVDDQSSLLLPTLERFLVDSESVRPHQTRFSVGFWMSYERTRLLTRSTPQDCRETLQRQTSLIRCNSSQTNNQPILSGSKRRMGTVNLTNIQQE